MNEILTKTYELKIETLKKRLENKRFKVSVVDNSEELIDLVRNIIEDNAKVSLGGSKTLEETGLLQELYKMDINLVDRYKEGITKEERDDLLREAFTSDYFVTSTNAISMDGALYNIDGTGNRVAAMCFGPKNVLVICGLNKICENEEDAKYRVRNIAAVANTIRFNKNAPCTKIGYCVNCECEDRICDSFVKIDRSHVEGRIHIIFVKENLGF